VARPWPRPTWEETSRKSIRRLGRPDGYPLATPSMAHRVRSRPPENERATRTSSSGAVRWRVFRRTYRRPAARLAIASTSIRKPLLYPSELRGHEATVACATMRWERAEKSPREERIALMYTRVYTTAPRSTAMSAFEEQPDDNERHEPDRPREPPPMQHPVSPQ